MENTQQDVSLFVCRDTGKCFGIKAHCGADMYKHEHWQNIVALDVAESYCNQLKSEGFSQEELVQWDPIELDDDPIEFWTIIWDDSDGKHHARLPKCDIISMIREHNMLDSPDVFIFAPGSELQPRDLLF